MKLLTRLFFMAGVAFWLNHLALFELTAKAADLRSQWQRCEQLFEGDHKATKKIRDAAIELGLRPDLPSEWPIVKLATHTYEFGQFDETRPFSVLLFAHVAAPDREHELIDMNRWPADRDPPKYFIISDGTTNRSLIGVDLSNHSPLTRWIDRIEAHIRSRLNNRPTPEGVLELLKTNVADFMGPVKNGSENGKADLPWDKVIVPLSSFYEPKVRMEDSFADGKNMYYRLRVEPLESYLEIGQGYCLAQSLANWLILRRFKIPAAVVNGSTSTRPGKSFGHTWIELADGRVLDSAQGILAWPLRRSQANADTMPYFRDLHNDDWMYLRDHKMFTDGQLQDTWRFRYKRYPVLVRRDDPSVPNELKQKKDATVEKRSLRFLGADNEID